jgi:hypothetical protein
MAITINGTGSISGLSAGGLTDATITQAEIATGVAGTGPSFSAYAGSSQSISSGVWTKLQINTEEWDTNSNFDTSTYRFTPTVAGYYQLDGRVTVNAIVTVVVVAFYKNGSVWKRGTAIANSAGEATSGSSLVYLNGTTDYVELYAFFSSTQNTFVSSDQTYFQASLVRAA